MPVYIFTCSKCGHTQEKQMRITANRKKEKCDKCGAKTIQCLTPVAFHLKGTGWHVTDYKNDDKKK